MEKLLETFVPEHYDLALNINKHAGTAKGVVNIQGTPKQSLVKFHAKGLTIDRVEINEKTLDYTQRKGALEIPLTEEVAKLNRPLELKISYHFDLNRNMQGAYLSDYEYEDRQELIVSTQFESHYARECFPCIDEPAAKATFSLAIAIPAEDKDDTVISNMPRQKKETKGDTINYIFETTPRMSTYLLAFCIGRFQKKSVSTISGVKVTTYAALNQSERSLDFANETAKQCLDFYDQTFGRPYPLAKLDQVAIPDFEAGAMENWGLVTYRESCLLADPKTTSQTEKQYIATVIAHELSHQWFGDLVTMKWWDDLWLNESFATVMEYYAINLLHPEYNIWREFFTGDCRIALERDALEGVQAVQQDVEDPEEIATLFDPAIVYAKGARLIFMLMRLMGDKKFFRGLKDYFKQYEYQNTTGDDLWEALQNYAKFKVKDLMHAWISQPGYPVIIDGVQQRFLFSGATDETQWPLPEIRDDMSGHYLIGLSGDEFEDALKTFARMPQEQKIRLIMDRALLARTSLVSSSFLLDLLPHFKDESSYPLWGLAAGIIRDLKLFIPYDDPARPDFQRFICQIIEPQLKRVGVLSRKKDLDNDRKLRDVLLGLALYADYRPALEELAGAYQERMEEIDPELRYDIIAAKMELSGEENFTDLLVAYQVYADPEIKADILYNLADAKNHTDELIDLLKKPKIVRPQNHIQLFAKMARNFYTRPAATEWIYQNWDYVKRMTGEKSIEDYLAVTGSTVRTQEEADRFLEFFGARAEKEPVIRRAYQLADEGIRARLRLLSLDNEAVHKRLGELA